MFQEFPYTNFHQLNLDWIVKIAKDFLDQYTHIQEVIQMGLADLAESRETGLNDLAASRAAGLEELNQKTLDGLADLQEKYDTLNGLLQAWYDTHSADIAGQLADAIIDFNTAAETKSQALLDSWPADYSELVTEYNNLMTSFLDVRNGIAYTDSIHESYVWEKGAMADGEDVAGVNNKRLRTVGYYLTENATIHINSGWQVVVYYYDENETYEKYVNWSSGTVKLDNAYKYYRLMFSNANANLDVSVSDSSHVQTAIKMSFVTKIEQNANNIMDLFSVIYDYSEGTVIAEIDRDFDSPAYDLTMTSGVLRGTRNSTPTAHPILLNKYIKKCQFYRGNPTNIVIGYNENTNIGLELNLTNGYLLWYNFNNLTYGTIKQYTLTNTVGGNALVKCDYDGEKLHITTTNGNEVVSISQVDLQGYSIRYGWESGQSGSNFNARDIVYIKPFDYDSKLINRMFGKNVYFIGDSITAAGSGSEAWRWQNKLESDIGIIAENYGVSQTCMTAASAEDTDAICVRYANMASGADYVFCMAGINDFGTNKPLGELTSTAITDFTGALKTFIEGVYNKYMVATNYQFKLYYACPYHVTDYYQSETNSLGLTQLDYVNRAKEICAMYGVPFLNMYESSGFNKINEAYLLYDHLHPGQTGNLLLANVIGLFLTTH